MKNVVFVTDSGFWVHDTDIVIELNKHYNLMVIITFVKGFLNHDAKSIIDFCKKNNLKLKLIDNGNIRARSLKRIFLDFKYYIKVTKQFKPDIIYIESFASPYLAIMWKLFFATKKIIVAIHDFRLHPMGKKKYKLSAIIYHFLSINLFRNFQLFSNSQKELFIQNYPKKNTFVARLFLLDLARNVKRKEKNKNVTSFLFFGRISYYKGVDVIIKAGNILSEKFNNFKIIIAGGCPNFGEYERLIKNRDIFELDVRTIPKEELPELFNKADFFLAPYREVTQSGPLMIAYYHNIITIASDEDGFKEYITDNVNGYLFQNENPASLADTMEKVMNLPEDEVKILQDNLKKFVQEEFNIKKVALKYITFFDEL